MMKVNARKSFTIGELAIDLGVSERTISRDLIDLSELGVPLYSIQGRGGGFKILNERMLPPIAFTESEAISIFFSAQSLKYYGSLPFGEGTESAMDKFYHYLQPDIKEQIDRLKDKVAIWSPNREMSAACLQVLLRAIMVRRTVTIEYGSIKKFETRDVQPIGLYSDRGYWYCPAYCFNRKAYRLFRADRILSAQLNEAIAFHEDLDLKSIRDWPDMEITDTVKTVLVVCLTAAGVRKLEPNGRLYPFIVLHEDGGGTLRMSIPVRQLAFYVDMIWGVSYDAKIIEPEEAVYMMEQNIAMMEQQYFTNRPGG
ncbi:putative DNA-binding transcriptional regulator YafY [Paenibacillus harenae]|nr:putative DNA-binding transcriptional regulator YafY [Paenibacillus harenae]